LETPLRKQRPNRFGLVVSVLQQQPGAREQRIGCVVDQLAQDRESVGTGRQGNPRFVAYVSLLQVRVSVGNVRGVADDQVESLVFQRFKQVAGQQALRFRRGTVSG